MVMTIIVNKKEYEFNYPAITYNQLLFLAGFNPHIPKDILQIVPFLQGNSITLGTSAEFTVSNSTLPGKKINDTYLNPKTFKTTP